MAEVVISQKIKPVREEPKTTWRDYFEVIKPERTLVNVITAVASFLLASAWSFPIWLFIKIVFGSGLIIASACVFNNLLDRRVDKIMQRTSHRVLVTRQVSGRNAICLIVILGVIGFILLLFINWLTFWVGVLAYISYVFIYGYSKRKTIWSTLIGTLPGGLSIVAGYTAFTNHLDTLVVLLFLMLLTWQMAHFYAIAVFRHDDYKSANLPIWSVKKGITSTREQILLFLALFFVSCIALSIALASWFFLVISIFLSSFWLIKTVSRHEAWAVESFKASLLVMLLVSISLTTVPLI